MLLFAGGTIYAQSTAPQAKSNQNTPQNTSQQKASTTNAGQSRTGNTRNVKSQATTGTPPTHINVKDSSASNPQNGGVNAQHKKASAESSGTGNLKKGDAKKTQQPTTKRAGQ
ncbi:hypothetical protein DYBT9623_00284 [Dyadobacter sp. CECT 9623]|uniref:Uncharacterized protein n=2 Tax=Dyadobacter linearis TaxID=2823330 RepID=A0ABM8UJJ8_9BACT|nr:hypothetical protein DYBT9623_00284 [Dyadobacter sp. CECT 9623]